MSNMNFERLLTFDRLEKPVRQHLKNVYATLAISMLVASAGAYLHLYTFLKVGGLLTVLGSIGFLVALGVTPHTAANTNKRLGLMGGFALLTGMGLGPLMDIVIRINPTIVPTAFLATATIFVCFTLAALLSDDRKFLYLGGMLFSGLSWLLMLGFMNIFFRSNLLFQVELYAGLAIMCGFILYDTQLIVEKRRMGNDDYIWHGVELFIDFVNLFRRIMVLLANKEDNKKRRN